MSGIDTTDVTKGPMADSSENYFANMETHSCAMEVWSRVEEYYNEMRRTGRMALYRNAYTNFYMGWIYRASMYKSGEMGELTRSFWNHLRNILLHLKVQTTQNKIAFKSQVRNSTAKSSQIVEFANGLSERYSESVDYDLDTKGKQAVEDCLVFAESSIVALWNRFKGDPVVSDPLTGQVYNDGDIEYFNVTPMDQIINTTHQSREQVQYRIVRRWINKYDLAAMYPKLANRVTVLNDSESSYGTKLVSLIHHDNETIPIFYFFHGKTPAVPKGRLLVMADPTCIFEDGPLDQGEGKQGYEEIPVYDMISATMQGSPFGYTVGFDLIPLQQALNELVSSVTTNNINFATQCVIGMKGGNIHYQSLATGMSYIEYDPKVGPNGKPEPLNLLSSKPETYQFIQSTIQNMETLAGISSMNRGQTNADVTSGQYAALITTQSILFNDPLQKAYARLMKKVMTGTIKILRKNMIGSKLARIVGSSNQPALREFTSADLMDIECVDVDLINPMLQTPAGKMNMADSLMKTGLIKDAQQYIGVYTDGDLPQLYHRQETQLRLVKQENEAILKGICPEVAVTDNHAMHILEHSPMIDTIEARTNPNDPVFIAAMNHIQKHLNKLAGGKDPVTGQLEGPISPILAGIIGDPTLPPGTPSQAQLPPLPPVQPQPGNAPQPQAKPNMPSAPAQTMPQTGMTGPQLGVAQ